MDLTILAIPFITAAIGYGTNWLAIQMIFKPMHFVGIGPIGWQGVLPRRSDTFARDVATMLEEKILSADELLDAIDLDQIEALLEKRLGEVAPELVGDIADVIRPGLWDSLAEPAQATILDTVSSEARTVTREVFAESRRSLDDLIDLRGMVEAMLSGENTGRLVQLFKEIGGTELRWVIRFGGVFGFVIGLAQAAFYSAFAVWWVLPLVGAIVGLGTNWLALQMIFRPQEPTQVLGVTFQGLFPKRQHEIAADYARVAEEEILTPANLLEHLVSTEAGARIAAAALEVAATRLETMRPMLELLAGEAVTDEHVAEVQAVIVRRIGDHAPAFRPELEAVLEESLEIGPTVESRLDAMSKPEFERLLRGLFEQDELLLIVVGGGLGLTVGLLQAAVLVARGG